MQSLFRSVVIGLVASGQISQAKTITTIITTDSIETATSTSTPMSESTVWTVHEAESEGTISSLHWASPVSATCQTVFLSLVPVIQNALSSMPMVAKGLTATDLPQSSILRRLRAQRLLVLPPSHWTRVQTTSK